MRHLRSVVASFPVGLIVGVCGVGTSIAATLYVGTNSPGAFATPQEAIDAAESGDEVLVAAGRYPGRLAFMGKNVVLRGAGIGRTQIEPGCGFSSQSGVDFSNLGLNLTIEDLSFFAECQEFPGLFMVVGSEATPTLRRVAVVARGPIYFGLGISLTDITRSGAIEDLYVEQLSSPCPANLTVTLDLNLPSHLDARRLFISGRCRMDLALLGHPEAPTNYRNVLVTTRGEWPSGVAPHTSMSHMTAAYSEPYIPASVVGVAVAEDAPLPALNSSVIAGTTRSPVRIYCRDAERVWDFHWNDFWPADPSYDVLADGIPSIDPWEYVPDPNWGPCPGPIPMEEAGNINLDPMFIHWTRDDNMSDDNFCPAPGSPLIDAGDPNELDPDGTRADIGAFGGPYAFSCEEVLDADGDGYRPITGDCDDANADRWPFHEEVPCDGVDQDCDGADATDCGDDDSADDDSSDDDSSDDDSADDDSALSSPDDDSAAPPESEPWSFLSSCISACEGEGGAALLLPIVLLVRRRFRVRSE